MEFPPPGADRLLVVISDIEMGAGGLTDDFPHSEWLAELVRRYASERYAPYEVVFVFNGDTFDFLKTSLPDGTYSTRIDCVQALAKWESIAAAHGPFLDAMSEVLARDRTAAVFVVGNHDQELLFPEVQAAISARLGGRVRFPGFDIALGDCWIEHGSQRDVVFKVDPQVPFIEVDGKPVLNLPWGAVALLEVAIPLQPMLYHLDRCKPRDRVLELLPEVKELLLDHYWTYWTQAYLPSWLSGDDPLRRLDWTVFNEIMYRYATDDTDVYIGGNWGRRLRSQSRYQIFVLGHEHRPSWNTWGDRKVLRTGAFRTEYMVSDDGLKQRPLPKVYAEIWQCDGVTEQSHLVELACPPLPPGYMPTTLYDVVGPVTRALRKTAREHARKNARVERERQRRREEGSVWPWS